MSYLLLFLPIIELSPEGLEASTYELFAMVLSCGLSLSHCIGNMLLPTFHLNAITAAVYHATGAPVKEFNSNMAGATRCCMIVGAAALMMYIGLQPKSKQQARAWHSDKRWHSPFVGAVNLFIGTSTL